MTISQCLKPIPLLIIVLILGTTLLCQLGFWQLSRAELKLNTLSQFDEAQAQAPLTSLGAFKQKNDATLRYRHVLIEGHLYADNTVLLDNIIHEGQVGYYVLVPLILNDNEVIFVNRGWLPAGLNRKKLPSIPTFSATSPIEGYLDLAYGNPLIQQAIESRVLSWPLRMQKFDPEFLQSQLGLTVSPWIIKLSPHSPYALQHLPSLPKAWLSPERHQGYAFQWFSCAVVFFLLCTYQLIRLVNHAGKKLH